MVWLTAQKDLYYYVRVPSVDLTYQMVNFRDPSVIAQDYLALVKLWHAVDGLYIWEFVTTISYEWSIVQGRRHYRWSIWIYSLTRLAALVAVICNILSVDVTTPINCQVLAVTQFIFAYCSLAAASFLVVLRIIAIWNKNKVVMASAAIIWVTNVTFLIRGVSRIRATRSPQQGCMITNTNSSKLNIIVTLTTEIALFLIMLFGLLRLRLYKSGTFALGRLLWNQGVIWFLLATLGEVPPTVLVFLNLNDPLNLMFQIPCLIIMSIAATRMYRALADFLSSDISYESAKECDLTIPTVMGTHRAPTPFARLEGAMYTTREEYSKPQMDMDYFHGDPYIGVDQGLRDKRRVLSPETPGNRRAESSGQIRSMPAEVRWHSGMR